MLKDVVFFGATEERVIALTLDDGPHDILTPAILDLLGEHNARATFFMIGSRVASTERDVVERVVSEGHELGNHTWADKCSALLMPSALAESIDRTHDVLARFAAPIRVFRPGAGWVTPWVLAAAKTHSYRCVLGSVYPQDVRIRSKDWITADVLARARPGAIVILHEGIAERARVLPILAAVLPSLRALGYRVTTVSELLALGDLVRK